MTSNRVLRSRLSIASGRLLPTRVSLRAHLASIMPDLASVLQTQFHGIKGRYSAPSVRRRKQSSPFLSARGLPPTAAAAAARRAVYVLRGSFFLRRMYSRSWRTHAYGALLRSLRDSAIEFRPRAKRNSWPMHGHSFHKSFNFFTLRAYYPLNASLTKSFSTMFPK